MLLTRASCRQSFTIVNTASTYWNSLPLRNLQLKSMTQIHYVLLCILSADVIANF